MSTAEKLCQLMSKVQPLVFGRFRRFENENERLSLSLSNIVKLNYANTPFHSKRDFIIQYVCCKHVSEIDLITEWEEYDFKIKSKVF